MEEEVTESSSAYIDRCLSAAIGCGFAAVPLAQEFASSLAPWTAVALAGWLLVGLAWFLRPAALTALSSLSFEAVKARSSEIAKVSPRVFALLVLTGLFIALVGILANARSAA